MALAGLTRLNKKDFLTADIWNALMDILEAKFAGGVGTSDITYPLVVQGDIDFSGGYGIVGLRKFWNVVNAAEYASLDAAVSAAEATSGGAVLIPPYTTISANNVSIDASNVTIFGFGPTSVLKITAAATGPLLTTASSGLTDIAVEDLALDGTGAGAGCKGIVMKKVTRGRMRRLYMTGFTDDFISLTNNGVAGQSCVDMAVTECQFSGGTGEHIFADDVSGILVDRNTSRTATGDAFAFTPVGAANLIQDLVITNNRIHGGSAKGIKVVGSGAAGIDAQSRIRALGNEVISCGGLPYEFGNTALLLKDVTISNNSAPASTTDAMRVAASGGNVTGNNLTVATSDGLDLTNSVSVWANGNNCASAGAYGINAASTTTCYLSGNNCSGAATDGINRTSSTNLRALENLGDDAPTVGNVFADFASYTRTSGSGAGAIGAFSYTIPANSFKTGDVLRITARVTQAGGGTGSVEVRAGGTGMGGSAIDATDNTMVWLIRILQTGAGTNTLLTNIREGVANNLVTNSSTIDWTTDLAITFQATAIAAQDIIVNGIFIELLGSK